MAPYRAAILGCGGRSDSHVRAYDFVDDAEVVACCDHKQAQREEFAARWGPRAYGDFAEMLEAEKPDIVNLVTRPGTRVEQLTQVSEAGVPACIVEKPIALGVRDWRALRDLAATTKTKIGVGAQVRYHENLSRCREAVATGELGKPLFVEATAGMNIANQGVHVLDWAMSMMDDAAATGVFGAASGASEFETTHPSPENTTATLTFANGVHALWTLGTEAPRVASGYGDGEVYTHCRVAVYCESGRVLYEEFGQWEAVGPKGRQSGRMSGWDDWANSTIARRGT
jgi:predicted dehydrogenase